MTDPFDRHSTGLTAPVSSAAAVTPSDAADLATVCRALYVGSAPVTLAAAAGWQPIRARRVWATGTTAADIVAGW